MLCLYCKFCHRPSVLCKKALFGDRCYYLRSCGRLTGDGPPSTILIGHFTVEEDVHSYGRTGCIDLPLCTNLRLTAKEISNFEGVSNTKQPHAICERQSSWTKNIFTNPVLLIWSACPAVTYLGLYVPQVLLVNYCLFFFFFCCCFCFCFFLSRRFYRSLYS